MAWGKNRGSPSSSSGRRRPPGELTEQDILRSIQQSAVRVRVSLQLGAEDDAESLQDLLSRFEKQFEARRSSAVTQRHHVRVDVLECGLNSWQQLLELQRVLAALKRPKEYGEEVKLVTRTLLKRDAKYDEWKLSLGFTRASEDELWRFASSLMLRLKSCGVLSRVLLASHRLTVALETAFVEWGSMEVDNYQWEGKHTWSQVVVELDEHREEIQRVFLPPIRCVTGDPLAKMRYPALVSLVDDMLSGNTDMRKPVVVILRGIPGSGKSTLGREIEVICRHRGVAFTACSADFLFETPRGYLFDVKKLGAAHSMCKANFARAIQGDTPRCADGGRATQHVVLVDNTSTQRWEYETYEDIARSRGSHVHIVEMRCEDTLMAYRMGQRNSHGVPPDKVVSMFMRWEEDPRAYSFTPQFEHPRLTQNPLSDGDVGGLTYLGLFLDNDSQQKLLSEMPPAHPSKLADHVTLFYRPNKQYTREAELGASFTVRGVEVVQDDRGQTLRVELDDELPLQMRNKIPHITISTIDGVSASYSNDLLESASAKRTMLDPPIELTTRLGAALFIQNQRVISTSPPFGVDMICSSKNVDTFHRDDVEKFRVDTVSRLFILYVSESDLVGGTEEDATKRMWHGQVLRSMGSHVETRRLLCVQRSETSSSSSLLSSLKTHFVLPSTQYFDDITVIDQQPPSFQGLEDTVTRFVHAASVGPIAQLTLLTSVAESTRWPLHKINCLQDASVSAARVDLDEKVAQTTTTVSILSALDLLGINIQEETRSAIFRGMSSVRDAWARVVGANDRYAVQRIDATLPGLDSSVVELRLTLPRNTSADLEVLETKLLRALHSSQSVRHTVRSCVPGQFFFSLSTLSRWAPDFCVRMTSQPHNAGSDDSQLKFCETQLRMSREICDIEAYAVLVALLRAILLGHCSSLLPSECRLSSLINLTSERLVLQYLENIDGVDVRPTADDVTSGRIIFSLYNLLTLLSKLSPKEWSIAFGDSLLELQGNGRAQAMWRQALEDVTRNCTAAMASHCVDLKQTTQLNPEDHVRVVVALTKTNPIGNIHASPTRTYIEVSSRSTWSSLHLLACCDKLRSAAAMVLAQDDDKNNGDRLEFFTCAPSLVSRRVDVACSSLDLLRAVLSKLDSIEGGSEGVFSGDYVIRLAETDEEIIVDLARSG